MAKTTLDEMMTHPLMPRPIESAPEHVDILIGYVYMHAISIGQVSHGKVYLRDRTDTELCMYDDDGEPPQFWWPMPQTFEDLSNLERDEV